jgi:cob(I)alamin adenosyltransferase
MLGLVHLYIGDGKGKTTASVGLALRAFGRDKKVIFSQFLKSGITGELKPLEKLGIKVIRSTKNFGFTHLMDEKTKNECMEERKNIVNRIYEALELEKIDLLVLDEILDALNTDMLPEETLRSLVENKELELVISGRNPPSWLLERADYISEVKKIKHPFDKGVNARIGIES